MDDNQGHGEGIPRTSRPKTKHGPDKKSIDNNTVWCCADADLKPNVDQWKSARERKKAIILSIDNKIRGESCYMGVVNQFYAFQTYHML